MTENFGPVSIPIPLNTTIGRDVNSPETLQTWHTNSNTNSGTIMVIVLLIVMFSYNGSNRIVRKLSMRLYVWRSVLLLSLIHI